MFIRCGKVEILFLCAVISLVFIYMRGMFLPNIFVSKNPVTVSLKELLVASIEAAERGGRMVVKVKEDKNLQIKSKGKTLEGANDPVTLGDLLSHQQMYYSILKMWPDLSVVSEENSKEHLNVEEIEPIILNADSISGKLKSDLNEVARLKDITIWIDPLDATTEYTKDLLEYVTTMVCVAHKGEPVIGVIHRPFAKQTIWAWVRHGSSDIPEFQTNVDDVYSDEKKIIVSFSHPGEVTKLAEAAYGKDKVKVITAGGAGYKSLYVAQRKANAYLHTTAIKKWDICAGNALLKAVGGEMTDLHGNEIDYSFPGVNKKSAKLYNGLLGTFKDHKEILSKLNDAKRKLKV